MTMFEPTPAIRAIVNPIYQQAAEQSAQAIYAAILGNIDAKAAEANTIRPCARQAKERVQ